MLYPGAYRNHDHVEDCLTIEEMERMYETAIDRREEEYRFYAALQGVEIPDPKLERVEEKIRQAEAKAYAQLTGRSEESYEFEDMIEFIDEDE